MRNLPPDTGDTLEEDDRRLSLRRAGVEIGYVDWRVQDEVLYVDYVHVSPALRGHGLGRRLVDAVADRARRTGLRLVPLCGYARRVLHADDRYRDVLAEGPRP